MPNNKINPKLTPAIYDFLIALSMFKEPATRGQIGPVTSPEEERGRRAAKRLRFARQRQRADGKWGWQITDAGNVILAEVRADRMRVPLPAPATPQDGEAP